MAYSREDFPQVTYQYFSPDTPLATGSAPNAQTKFIYDKIYSRKHSGSNTPTSNDQTRNRPQSAPARTPEQISAFDLSETKPTSLNISVHNKPGFQLIEIQFSYGIRGSLDPPFALRFPDDGSTPQLVFDPYGDDEYELDEGSMDYRFRIDELKGLIKDCADDPDCYVGRAYATTKGRSLIKLSNEDHQEIAHQSLEAIDRQMGRSQDR